MTAVDAARITPLSWPPTSDATGRWMPRVVAALAVELDACWSAHELAQHMTDDLDGQSLPERLSEVESAAMVCHDTSDVIAVLGAHVPEAAVHLCAADEARLRALGTLRDRMWLARHRLLDAACLPAAIEQVAAELAVAGRSIAAADRVLLDAAGWLAGASQTRE